MTSLTLEVEDQGVRNNPSADEIANALATVDGKKSGYAILSQSDLSYIQTSGSVQCGLDLEYQDGSLKERFRCPDDLSFEEVVAAFQSYAKGDEWWRTAYQWERMEV